jgi:hypothetical protein
VLRHPFRLGQAIAVVAAVAFLLAVVIAGGQSPAPAGLRAGFELGPQRAGGPSGVAYLAARGGRLTGHVAVWGLAPGSRHAAALRGPDGGCGGGGLAQVVAPLPVLAAGSDGVAFARIDVARPSTGFGDGLALTVHAGADPAGPALACGAAPKPLEP